MGVKPITGIRVIEGFLSHLVVQQKVATTTQRQVLNAIVFLYKISWSIARWKPSPCRNRISPYFVCRLQGDTSPTPGFHPLP
jgi:hypothetical protein